MGENEKGRSESDGKSELGKDCTYYKGDDKIPYPSLEGICGNAATLRIISPAYAGNDGELTAVLQYVYQHTIFEELGYDAFAKNLMGIAITEMKHLGILAGLILKSGAAPTYAYFPSYPVNYYTARSVCYAKIPQKMLLADIMAERRAIGEYEKILSCVRDERVSAVIRRILSDEKEHLKSFECMLQALLEGRGNRNCDL